MDTGSPQNWSRVQSVEIGQRQVTGQSKEVPLAVGGVYFEDL